MTPDPTPPPHDHGAAGFCTDHAHPPDERTETVVLCGSTRFYDEFQQANYDLTMAGKIVLSVGFYPHAKARHGHGEGVGHDSAEKAALDELHKRKIDLADRVLVLNVGGYIGESTFGEIEYAWEHRKPIDYLVPLGQCSCDDGDRHPMGLPCGPSAALGLTVTEHTLPGDVTFPDGFALAQAAAVVAALDDDDDIECTGCDREGPAAFWDDDDQPWCATCHDAHYATLWAERDAARAEVAMWQTVMEAHTVCEARDAALDRVRALADEWAGGNNESIHAAYELRAALDPEEPR